MIKKYSSMTERHTPQSLFIHDNFVSAMNCSKQGSDIEIISCGIEYFSKDPDEKEIANKIKKLAHRCQISLYNVCVILSLKNILIKEIILPKIKSHQIEDVLSFEMEKHIPFNIEEIYYDFISIKKESIENTLIVLAVLQKNIYEKAIETCKNYEIFYPFLPLKESLIGNYYFYYSKIFRENSVLLIDLTNGLSPEFSFYEKGDIKFFKNISVEEDIFQMKESHKKVFWDDFVKEVERSVHHFQSIQNSQRPSYLKIHSFKDLSDQWFNHICESLKMKNIVLEHSIEREYLFSYSYAISFFESRQILVPRMRKEEKNILVTFFPHILIFLFSVFFIQMSVIVSFYKKITYLKTLKVEIKDKKIEVKNHKKLMKKVQKLINQANKILVYKQQKNSVLTLLKNLMHYLPSKTFIFSLEKNLSGEVFFKGMTAEFLDMKQRLDLCPFIDYIKILPVREIEVKDQFFTVFEGNFYFGKTEWRESCGQK